MRKICGHPGILIDNRPQTDILVSVPVFVENPLRFPVKDAVEIRTKSREFCASDLIIVARIWVDKNSFGHPCIFAFIQPGPEWQKQLLMIEVDWIFGCSKSLLSSEKISHWYIEWTVIGNNPYHWNIAEGLLMRLLKTGGFRVIEAWIMQKPIWGNEPQSLKNAA